MRAHFSDGHVEDVTRWAKFASTDESVARVDESGKVTVVKDQSEAKLVVQADPGMAAGEHAVKLEAKLGRAANGRAVAALASLQAAFDVLCPGDGEFARGSDSAALSGWCRGFGKTRLRGWCRG